MSWASSTRQMSAQNCHYMASISGNPLSDQYDLGSALVVPSQSKGPSTPQGSASNSRHCLPVRTRLSSVADNRAVDSQAAGKQERCKRVADSWEVGNLAGVAARLVPVAWCEPTPALGDRAGTCIARKRC